MSDLDNDLDIQDFDSSLDSVENDNANSNDYSISEVDAVTELLLTGETSGAHKPKANDTGMRSRDVDSHGKVDWSTNAKPAEEPSYAGNQSAPDMESAQARINNVDAQSQQVMSEWEALQQMQADLPPEVFAERQQFLQGQAAGLMIQRQQAVIEQMNDQQWLREQEAQVREKHADIFNDPQKRDLYGKKMTDYLGSIGYSREELNNIGAREYNAVLDHIKVTEERDRLKVENAKLKQAHRQRQQSLKQGRRDIETGAGRSKKGGGDVYDEVARILGGVK